MDVVGLTLPVGDSASARAPDVREERRRVARRNLRLTSELLSLLDVFQAHGIRATPFKGPVLAVVAYGNVGLRHFRDLDILVLRRDAERARQLLLQRDYCPEVPVEPGHEAALLASGYHYPFRRDDGLAVELHWALGPREFPCPLDVDDVWTRLQPVPLGGRTVYTLGSEDLLLFLCAHGGKHCWWRLQWVADVAHLIAREGGLDWDAIVGRARARGAERILLLGLLLSHELLDAPTPESLLARARADRSVRAPAEDVRARLLAPNPAPLKPWRARLFHVRIRERWRDRARYVWFVVTTPNAADWRVVRLPARLQFLYYVVRPFRLAVKYARHLVRGLAWSVPRLVPHQARYRRRRRGAQQRS